MLLRVLSRCRSCWGEEAHITYVILSLQNPLMDLQSVVDVICMVLDCERSEDIRSTQNDCFLLLSQLIKKRLK